MDEARGGEDVGSRPIVESILDKCNSASLSMANVNRAHRVGQSQRNSSQHGKPCARQIIVQFKDYDSKVEVMRSRKMLRNAMPNVYVNEDLTQVRSALLFKARALKREKRLTDCWSYSPVNLWFDLDKIATETLFVGTDSHTHPEQHIKNIEQSK